jgi:HEAT repeat protein
VARALGDLGDVLAIDALIECLDDPHYGTRLAAAESLGALNATQATSKLVDLLRHDEDDEVRRAAADTLGKVGDLTVVDPLMERLLRDPDDHVRESAASALGNIGDARAFDPLVQALPSENRYLRTAIISALVYLDDSRVVGVLASVAQHDIDKTVRLTASVLVNKLRAKAGA